MANIGDIQHNLKVGSDTELFFTREVTSKQSNDYGKLKTKDGVYRFPYLTRMTGDSIKGSTEAIESNELRKGRTASKKRLGNESTTGSLDVELSPTTFDDQIAAVFKNEWKSWTSDETSAINIDNESGIPDGFFLTRAYDTESKDEYGNWGGDYEEKGLLKARRLLNDGETGHEDGLITVPKGSVVHELTCGTQDIKYDVLRKIGGTADEDLYQEYPHMAVDSMSLDIQLGAIVTGSFNFAGTSNPKRYDESDTRVNFGGDTADRFADGETTGNKYMNSLPEKSTSTDQFTSLVGNLWFNGKNLTVAQSLSFEIANNLQQKNALFVKKAIATTSQKLDITGSLGTYVVFGETEKLYNSAIDNSTNEIMFLLQDKEENPENLYLFQIFKSSFDAPDSSQNSGDTYEDTYNFTSFEERACRVFRIALPTVRDSEFTVESSQWTDAGTINLIPNVALTSLPSDFKLVETLTDSNNTEVATMEVDTATVNADGTLTVNEGTFTALDGQTVTNGVTRKITVTMNGIDYTHSFGKDVVETTADVTELSVKTSGTRMTATWLDSESSDASYLMVKLEKGTTTTTDTTTYKQATEYEEGVTYYSDESGTTLDTQPTSDNFANGTYYKAVTTSSTSFTADEGDPIAYERVETGTQSYSRRGLLAGSYKFTVTVYDTYGNASSGVSEEFTI